MDLWSVDVWQVRQESEDEFLKLLRERSVGGDRIFRDRHEARKYWVPRHWESQGQFEDWHKEFAELSAEMVEAATTHPMTLVKDDEDD